MPKLLDLRPAKPKDLTLIAPLVPTSEPEEWSSTGVRSKPPGCQECQFRTKGSGFVPDWYPVRDGSKPRVALLLDYPSSDDVLENRPFAGKAGFAWEKLYLKPFGLSLQNTLISHVLRCQPKDIDKFGRRQYPTGGLRRAAEIRCRQHDGTCWGGAQLREGSIHAFNPNLFVVTFRPDDAMETPALRGLIQADMQKAVEFADQGYRPLVLMGDEARELVMPWSSGKGGTKNWRGTFFEGSWPWSEESDLVVPGFYEA